ncbi:unnamed protein product [Adineta steineri]|uniref:Uncharacterized protein n=1 Tax=Adineta steineri TaxID=433720 RepID=A0A819V7U0_9BILA|nr:unnamed protein product [Adineta steineri]CAF4104902.1 unnamed protein product [Adineta steineri]
MDQSEKAIRYYENLLEEAKDDENSFIALFGLAIACLNNEQVEQANEYISRCCKLYESIPGGTIYGRCRIFDLLGSIAHRQNRPELAIHYYTEILKIVPEDDTDMISIANTNLASIYYSQDNTEVSLQHLQQALQLDEVLYSIEDLHIATDNFNIGVCYYKQNELHLALKYYEQSLAIREKVLPSLHIDIALTHIGLGETNFGLKNFNQSIDHWKNGLVIIEKERLCNSTEQAIIHENIAACYSNMNDFTHSLWYCNQSLLLHQEHHSTRNLFNLYFTYGNVYYGINEFDKAIESFMMSLTLIDDNNERKIAQIYENISECYVIMDEHSLAITYLEKSLAIQEKLDPMNEIIIANICNNIVTSYCSLEKYNLALEYCTKSKEYYEKCSCDNMEEYGVTLGCSLVAVNYEILANICFDREDQTTAFDYYCNALDIIKSRLPVDQRALARVQKLLNRINEVEF